MQQQERRVRPQLAAEQLQQQQQPQKCPRCDSPNTKFCYYNNYSLSQPRYFCKTCRRYWTQGGTLRNVPVGGGCRKGKRSRKPSSSSSSSSFAPSYPSATTASADSGFHPSLLLPQQQPQQDSILVATSAPSAGPLRNVTDAIAATASGCSTSPSVPLPYYSAGGGGFFSSLIAMQSYNHAMNAADFAGLSSPPPAQAATNAPFNHPPLTGFDMPLHHQRQRIQPQPAAGFQLRGGAVDRPLQQFLMPSQPTRSSAGASPASFEHQEWPPQTITPDVGYWQSNVGGGGAGGPPSSGGHWPDLPGFGPSSSSPSFL